MLSPPSQNQKSTSDNYLFCVLKSVANSHLRLFGSSGSKEPLASVSRTELNAMVSMLG